MKIPTKFHGLLDYIVGLLFLCLPSVLGLETDEIPAKVFQYLGMLTIAYSLLTRYEHGLVKLLPMKVHLGLDIASGIFLMISPWLFGFADQIFIPYTLFGLLEVIAGILTSKKSGYEKKRGL
jgi:hypothetical protein